MKKQKWILSLRTKTTLLCAVIIIAIAAGLTFASIFSADRIFVQNSGAEVWEELPNVDKGETTSSDGEDGSHKSSTTITSAESKSATFEAGDITVTQSIEGQGGEGVTVSQPLPPADKGMVYSIAVTKKTTFAWVNIVLMILLALIGILAAYFLTGRALKPITRLSDKIREMDESNLSERLSGNLSCAEVSHLTDAFNKMLSRLDTAFQSQKQFASAAAHELKTPLASMQTNLEVLEMDGADYDEELDHTLKVLKKNICRMNDLVDDLLALNAHNALELNEDCDFGVLVQETVGELDREIEKKHIRLTQNCTGTILGNRNLTGRAVFNLIENAVKYNRPDGWISVTAEEDQEWLTLVVRNSGAGIPADELEHIFDPFYRVDKSRSRVIAGSGLGLAIVKSIVELHGGRVTARSDETETVFEARFLKRKIETPAS